MNLHVLYVTKCKTVIEYHSLAQCYAFAVYLMLGLAVGDTSAFGRAPDVNPWAREPIEDWWNGGQKLTNERFDLLYAERNLKAIRCLGVATLPKLMEKLAEGDYGLLSTVDRVTLHKADLTGETPAEQAASCLAW